MLTSNRSGMLGLAALLALAGLAGAARGAQITWSGTPGDGVRWSDKNNWVGGVAPVSGDGVTFTGAAKTTTADLGAGVLISNITLATAPGSVINGAVSINAQLARTNIQDSGGSTINASIAFSVSDLYVKNTNVNVGAILGLAGVISGAPGVRIHGPGIVEYQGEFDNTYSGLTVVAATDGDGSGGVLQLNAGAFNAVPGSLRIGGTNVTPQGANNAQVKFIKRDCIATTAAVSIFSDGLLDTNGKKQTIASLSDGGNTNAGNVTLGGSATLTIGDATTFTFSGAISGTGNISKTGTGEFDVISSSDTYTGNTVVNQGTLGIRAPASAVLHGPVIIGNNLDAPGSATVKDLVDGDDISASAPVTINASGVLDISGGLAEEHVGSLSGTGKVALGALTLIIGGDGTMATFDGLISGTGGLSKAGTGVQVLTKNNTYTGSTTVIAGGLVINGVQAGSNVLVRDGSLAGTGTVGTLTGNASSNVAPGVGGTGALNSNAFAQSGSNFTVNANTLAAGGFGSLNVTGTVTLGGPLVVNLASGISGPIGQKLVIIDNDGADAVTGTFDGLAEGASFTAGGQLFSISYKGGTGNDVELTVQNVAPVITSGAMAQPSPAGAGQTVTFTVIAVDGNNDTETAAWDFGDGSNGTGLSTTHAYTAPGTYNVAVTVSDGHGGTAASATMVVVNGPLVGEGLDTDGDGFSDAFETAAGSDPMSAASTPTGQAIVTPLPALVVKSLSIKLNFAKANKDAITMSGTVTVPSLFPAGKVVVDIGGVAHGFTVTAKGQGKDGKNSIKIGTKAGAQKYSVKLTGSFAAALADEGLVSKDDKGSAHSVVCNMLFIQSVFQVKKAVTYKAKLGKSGAAK